jgi:hypothetical protein
MTMYRPRVSSVVPSVTSWFQLEDERVDRLAEHVIRQQMRDGGWNCLATPGYGKAIGHLGRSRASIERCATRTQSARRHTVAAISMKGRSPVLLGAAAFRSPRIPIRPPAVAATATGGGAPTAGARCASRAAGLRDGGWRLRHAQLSAVLVRNILPLKCCGL